MPNERPPGWSYNPSAWSERLPVMALAVVGFGIATYLALYQLDVFATVWEPFFGSGSRQILRESSIAHMLPIPDAALGALLYLVEAVIDTLGGEDRWRSKPWAVLLLGAVAVLLGVGGAVLAVCQPLLFGAFCTLCLASALCSVLILGAVLDEVWAAWEHLRRESARGRSFWSALWGARETQSSPAQTGGKETGAWSGNDRR